VIFLRPSGCLPSDSTLMNYPPSSQGDTYRAVIIDRDFRGY